MNLNLSALRDSLPISVESTPRRGHTPNNNNKNNNSATDADLIMPDLVSDGGGNMNNNGGCSGPVTPRTSQDDWNDQDEGGEDNKKDTRSQAHLNHVSQTVSLVDSFNQVYQRQINYYDQNFEAAEAMRMKEHTYKRWISDFAEHNRVLLATIADMEYESEQRLEAMESKMKEERTRQGEHAMANRVHRLESDLRTLVRLIRRAQAEGVWRTEGLLLQDQQFKDVLSPNLQLQPDMNVKLCIRGPNNEIEEQMISIPLSRLPISGQVLPQSSPQGGHQLIPTPSLVSNKRNPSKAQINKQDPRQQQQQNQLRRSNASLIREDQGAIIPGQRFSNPTTNAMFNDQRLLRSNLERERLLYQQQVMNGNSRSPGFIPVLPIAESGGEEEDNWRRRCEKLKRENHDLNKNLLDNRVLALEVAEKHDQILRLKTEVNQLEENLRQANMQTHFKDDVIKELRRDCRNLMNPNPADAKRSVSVCLIPKHNDLDVPKTVTEERREMRANVHNLFLNELGVLVDVLDENQSDSCINGDPLETRIVNGVKELKEKWLAVQDERDVLRNNNRDLESKLAKLLSENMDLNRMTQTAKHESTRKSENQRALLLRLKQTMVANQVESALPLQNEPQEHSLHPSSDPLEEEDEDFLISDTNRVLFDANRMLIDLKNEIDNKNLVINNNSLLLEGLKEEVVRKTQSLEQLRKGHKEALFEKDKMIIDLENSIRNHNNRIEDLEVEKMKLENEVVELKRAVEQSPTSDQLLKDQLEIECANQRTTISNLKEALESLKRDPVSQHYPSSGHTNSNQQGNNNKNLWNWLKNMHDV